MSNITTIYRYQMPDGSWFTTNCRTAFERFLNALHTHSHSTPK